MAHPLIGQVLQGTYRVERLLGAGGMGTVYEASHTRLPRRFAIKVLTPSVVDYPEAVARFQREARIASSLGHQHIIEVVDFNNTEEGIPYIVMEFLDGADLAALLSNSPRLEVTRSLAIVEQVCSALQASHKQGVIHRDLKPSNIFLCKTDEAEGDLVKVVDFGISKVLGTTGLTQSQSTIGTPWYMSPEQAEGRSAQVDSRTDIFALGTILYEMLSGTTPFAAETIPSVLYKVVYYDPPLLSERRPDAPAGVVDAVSRAMSKAPADRFATMAELAAALKGDRVTKNPGSATAAVGAAGAASAMAATLPAGEQATSVAASAAQQPDHAFSPTKIAVTVAVFVLVASGALLLRSIIAKNDVSAPTLDQDQGSAAAAKVPADHAPLADLSRGPATAASNPDSSPEPEPEKPRPPRKRRQRRVHKHQVIGQSTDKRVVCTLINRPAKVEVERVPCRFEVAHGSRIKLIMVVDNAPMTWERVVTRDMTFRYPTP